jgi:hypothetical protein
MGEFALLTVTSDSIQKLEETDCEIVNPHIPQRPGDAANSRRGRGAFDPFGARGPS